jgi:hypothetical protein
MSMATRIAFCPVDWRMKVERANPRRSSPSSPTPGSQWILHQFVLAKFRPTRRPTAPHWPRTSGRVRGSRGRSLGQQQLGSKGDSSNGIEKVQHNDRPTKFWKLSNKSNHLIGERGASWQGHFLWIYLNFLTTRFEILMIESDSDFNSLWIDRICLQFSFTRNC